MQVVTPGGCGDGFLEHEFYDTISAPPCKVRFRTSDFGQRLVIHCHVMFHSDIGSMAWFDVKGKGMPLYELTTAGHDCSGNPTPSPTDTPTKVPMKTPAESPTKEVTLAPTNLQMSDLDKLDLLLDYAEIIGRQGGG